MGSIGKFAAGCAALVMLATPGAAQAEQSTQAESLRRLDIMLMVTSLRCRTTADNFQADYQQFSSSNLTALNAAARSLQAELVGQAGVVGARKALDRISVGMANQYGRGHPWLGCGELKRITRDLATTKTTVQLLAAADELLASGPRGQLAMAATR